MNDWVLDRLVLGSPISSLKEICEGLWVITTTEGATFVLRWAGVVVEVGETGDKSVDD